MRPKRKQMRRTRGVIGHRSNRVLTDCTIGCAACPIYLETGWNRAYGIRHARRPPIALRESQRYSIRRRRGRAFSRLLPGANPRAWLEEPPGKTAAGRIACPTKRWPQTYSHRPGRLGVGRGRPINNRPQVANRLPTCPTSLQQSACGGIESSRRAKQPTSRVYKSSAQRAA
jgi:hypothetical protein